MKAWDLKTQTYCDIYNCTGLRNGKDVRIERMIGHLLGWSCAYLLHDTNSYSGMPCFILAMRIPLQLTNKQCLTTV